MLLLVSILMSKIIFIKYWTTCSAQIGPKIKNAQDLLTFGTFDISNIPIWILMSKVIFIKYLPLLWPKLVPKWKVLRIYWNLTHSMLQICQSGFWCQKWFLGSIYQIPGQINSKIKIALRFRFDTSSIPILLQELIKVSLNNYYMLCQNWSPSLNSNLDYKM